jgi:hypothetical protein
MKRGTWGKKRVMKTRQKAGTGIGGGAKISKGADEPLINFINFPFVMTTFGTAVVQLSLSLVIV